MKPIYQIADLKHLGIVKKLKDYAQANPFDVTHPTSMERYREEFSYYGRPIRICFTIDTLPSRHMKHLSLGSIDDGPLPDDQFVMGVVRLFLSNPMEIPTVLHRKARVRQFIQPKD